MSFVKRDASLTKSKREYVGKAWINQITKGKNEGENMITIRLNQDVSELTLNQDLDIALFPNQKREGKQDADYQVSVSPKVAQATE